MWTITKIKQANKDAGQHWFDPATLRFFAGRVLGDVWEGPGGVFFVTSEQFIPSAASGLPPEPRKYTVRKFLPDTGRVDTHGEFQAYATPAQARKEAARAARGEFTYDEAERYTPTDADADTTVDCEVCGDDGDTRFKPAAGAWLCRAHWEG